MSDSNDIRSSKAGDYFQRKKSGRLTGRDFSPFDFPFDAFEFSEYDKATVPTLQMKSPWEFSIEDGKPITVSIRELDREYLPTSNHNVHIFYQNSSPSSGVYYADIWVDSDSSGPDVYKYCDSNGAYYGSMAWRKDPDIAETLLMSWARSNITGEIYIWFKAAEPSGSNTGDLWFDTDGRNNLYRYDGASWVQSDMSREERADLFSHVSDHFDLSSQWDYSAVAPAGLAGTQYLQGVKLWWSISPLARSVKEFIIERASGSSPADADFSQVDTTEDRTYVDTPSFNTGSDGEPVATTYTYRVKSRSYTLDVSVASNEASVTLNPDLQGALTVSSVIQSSDFSSGSDGWQIKGNGNAEFNNITVRGTIYADTGNIGDWIIAPTSIQSDSDGNARIDLNPGDNRIEVWADTGTEPRVSMGYLGGLSDPSDRSVDLSSNIFGFWAAEGDKLEINGDMVVRKGQYQLEDDAALEVIETSTNDPLLRFGSASGVHGVHFYDSGTIESTLKWDNTNNLLSISSPTAIEDTLHFIGYTYNDVTDEDTTQAEFAEGTLTDVSAETAGLELVGLNLYNEGTENAQFIAGYSMLTG